MQGANMKILHCGFVFGSTLIWTRKSPMLTNNFYGFPQSFEENTDSVSNYGTAPAYCIFPINYWLKSNNSSSWERHEVNHNQRRLTDPINRWRSVRNKPQDMPLFCSCIWRNVLAPECTSPQKYSRRNKTNLEATKVITLSWKEEPTWCTTYS